MFTSNIKFFQKIVIFEPIANTFLALKRNPKDKTRPGLWDFPGGNVDFGENHLEALKREIKEEVGLDVSEIKPGHIYTEYSKEAGLYKLFIGYIGKLRGGNIQLSHEHIEYKWVTKEEFLELESADYLVKFINSIDWENIKT